MRDPATGRTPAEWVNAFPVATTGTGADAQSDTAKISTAKSSLAQLITMTKKASQLKLTNKMKMTGAGKEKKTRAEAGTVEGTVVKTKTEAETETRTEAETETKTEAGTATKTEAKEDHEIRVQQERDALVYTKNRLRHKRANDLCSDLPELPAEKTEAEKRIGFCMWPGCERPTDEDSHHFTGGAVYCWCDRRHGPRMSDGLKGDNYTKYKSGELDEDGEEILLWVRPVNLRRRLSRTERIMGHLQFM